jgi:hypothetical protein
MKVQTGFFFEARSRLFAKRISRRGKRRLITPKLKLAA